jgi:HK97 family phage portal protein
VRLLRRKQAEERALTRATLPSAVLPEPLDDVPGLGPRAALRIADVYATVRVLVDAAASLPLHTFRRAEQGRVRHEGALAALLERPAPGVTTAGLVGSIMASLQLHGDAFVGLYRDADGRVAQLGLLAPEALEVKLEGGEVIYLLLSPNGVARLSVADVAHVRAPLPEASGLRGLSPIRACATALGLSRDLARHAASFAAKGARPAALVVLDKDVRADEATRAGLRDELRSGHAGGRAGEVIVLGGGVTDFKPMALTMQDAQFVEQRVHSAQEVARIFRVPPSMLGLPSGDSLTYSTVAEEARAFVRWSLGPWLRVIEEALSAHPELSPSTQFCQFNLDSILAAAPGERATFYESALRAGWMTVDEVRRVEDLLLTLLRSQPGLPGSAIAGELSRRKERVLAARPPREQTGQARRDDGGWRPVRAGSEIAGTAPDAPEVPTPSEPGGEEDADLGETPAATGADAVPESAGTPAGAPIGEVAVPSPLPRRGNRPPAGPDDDVEQRR